jgi:hypothetical protein
VESSQKFYPGRPGCRFYIVIRYGNRAVERREGNSSILFQGKREGEDGLLDRDELA